MVRGIVVMDLNNRSRGTVQKVRALVMLTRPPNAIMMFIAILSGVLLSENKVFQLEKLLLAFITAYCLCGGSMGFNDYFDREVDTVNAPWRPIPSGMISEFDAVLSSSILAFIGIISAAATSMPCLIIAVIAFAAAFIYNARLKKMGILGNNVVSVIVTAPFIYGSVLSDGYISPRLITFIIPVYLSNLGREVIKGISDVKGDAMRGVRSVARMRGEKFAAKLGATFHAAAVFTSPFPYLLGLVKWSYIPIVLIADVGFIVCAISITRNPSRGNSLKVKNWTLLWMLIALIAFIAGSL